MTTSTFYKQDWFKVTIFLRPDGEAEWTVLQDAELSTCLGFGSCKTEMKARIEAGKCIANHLVLAAYQEYQP